MIAKDTVMKTEHCPYFTSASYQSTDGLPTCELIKGKPCNGMDCGYEEICQVQAEISFKAGMKEATQQWVDEFDITFKESKDSLEQNKAWRVIIEQMREAATK